MTALERLDSELEQRDFSRLTPRQIAEVRRLCTQPVRAEEIFYERLLLGCVALEERESDRRWQLFELLLTGWRCCQLALEAERDRLEAAETWARHHDPERQATVRRLAALNRRSIRNHLEHEAQKEGTAPQVAPPHTDNRTPQLIRRHRKGTL